ncbi:MAG: GNAT family N-acetyltransferase [Planctomycetia bacterium]|nr:GNAT family N-acetyltransferase [Planctomycetia bacterium]
MQSTLVLRALRPADAPVLGRLLREAGNFNEAEVAVGVEVIEAGLRPGQGDYRFVVAEEDGRVLGYACWGLASLSDGTWDLYWVAVDARGRGRGIGRMLVEHCEEVVKKERGRSLLVETSSRPGYEGTLAFYRSLGYEVLARFRDYYTAGDDKVVFGKYFSF